AQAPFGVRRFSAALWSGPPLEKSYCLETSGPQSGDKSPHSKRLPVRVRSLWPDRRNENAKAAILAALQIESRSTLPAVLARGLDIARRPLDWRQGRLCLDMVLPEGDAPVSRHVPESLLQKVEGAVLM